MQGAFAPLAQHAGSYVIAEGEINHNGNLATALAMVEAAREAGADALKLQYIIADEIATSDSPYYGLFKKVELPQDAFRQVFAHARAVGIDCFLTVPGPRALERVVDLAPPMIKVGSTNLTNTPLLHAIGTTGIPVLLSTGLGTLGEVEAALAALDATPEKVGLFHCTVRYPAPLEDLNLRAITTLQAAFPGYTVGFSDHTEGEWAACAAVALGARVFEKHFTLDRAQEGPDHSFSTDPAGFVRYVHAIRGVESALGDGVKRPVAAEQPHVRGARRYLVAARPIAAGAALAAEDLACRRIPADRDGMEPALLARILGWRAPRAYTAGEPIAWSDFAGGGQ